MRRRDYRYAYDGAGNRVSQTVNGQTKSYSYNAANQLTAAGATTYAYDANGNETGNSAGRSASYNAANQLTSITPAGGSAIAMTYAGVGQTERAAAGATSFTRNGLGLGVETTSGASTYYTRDSSGALLGQRRPEGKHYYLLDALGSVVGVTDGAGKLAATYRYGPFGELASSTGSVVNAWRFAGEYQDTGGLYKIGERYYDPTLGRWTQQDPLRQVTDPTQVNRYPYAGDDPVNNVDPSGCGKRQVWQCLRRWCPIAAAQACARLMPLPWVGAYAVAACAAVVAPACAWWCYRTYRNRNRFP